MVGPIRDIVYLGDRGEAGAWFLVLDVVLQTVTQGRNRGVQGNKVKICIVKPTENCIL